MKLQRAGGRNTAALIFALALAGITVSAFSQQTTAPAKPEAPRTGSPMTAPPAHPPSLAKEPAAKPVKKVDINNATLSELRALPLGEAEANKVIAHRPYKSKGELMTKAGLPEGVYLVVKDRVELQRPRKAASKK